MPKTPDGRLSLSPSEATPEIVRMKDHGQRREARGIVLRGRAAAAFVRAVDPMPTDAELLDCKNLDDVKRLALRGGAVNYAAPPSRSFRAFLVSIREEDTPMGDLARDSLRDTRWTGATAASLGAHMRSTGEACAEAHAAYHDLAARWGGK